MIATEAVEKAVIRVRKYWTYLFVPVFLLAAFIYVDYSHTQYKVTARIALRDKSPQDVVRDLGSGKLVQKTISQLPLQLSYYKAESPRDEVYGDSIRVALLFDHAIVADEGTQLEIDYDGSGPVALTHVDTTAYYDFNKQVHESYGDFRLIHCFKADSRPVSYIVKVQNPIQVFAEYNNNLRLESNDADGSVTVSILTGNPKKGVDFLNKMLSLYGGSSRGGSRYASIIGQAAHPGHLTILEKPENNIEQASASPFWIYLIALVAGLLTPVAFTGVKSRKEQARIPQMFKLPKLAARVHHAIPVEQLD